jgi:transposase
VTRPSKFAPEFRARATEELKRLRKENAELKRTNEIWRLASAFFAQEADPTRRRS